MALNIERLLKGLRAELEQSRSHKLLSKSEQDAFKRISAAAFPEGCAFSALRKAAFLEAFAERIPVEPKDAELIMGSQRFVVNAGHGNLGHIIVDYGRFLANGVDGMLVLAGGMRDCPNKEPFLRSLRAFSLFVKRHADACRLAGLNDAAAVCERVSGQAPRSFREALQLLWFVHVFLHAEGSAAAVSFGRFDQYMAPFLKRDLLSGSLDFSRAKELLSAFFIKTCEGDESQNLTLGGTLEDGSNAENELSILCLETIGDLRLWQPSLSVRLHSGSSKEFRYAAAALAMKGFGQPSFFNDPTVVSSLHLAGVAKARAVDYGIVGCYEAAPQGDSCPLTVAGRINLPATLLDFLSSAPSCESFDSFLSSYKARLKSFYETDSLPSFEGRLEALRLSGSSPFEGVCVGGCLESGLCPEEGGARFSLFGVNVMGIGTLVDSLAAIKRVVFDEARLSLAELSAELAANFPSDSLRALCLGLPEKFGRDEPLSNSLAEELSKFVSDMVLSSRLGSFRPYPGLFWFGGDIAVKVQATPDGRRDGERLSYGCGPGETEGLEATAVLKSVSSLFNAGFPCGNPLKLSFRRGDLDEAGLLSLIDGFFKLGGFHLHVNVADASELKAALERPEEHLGLTVRISGFSAVFVKLDKAWQDAIIARSEKSL